MDGFKKSKLLLNQKYKCVRGSSSRHSKNISNISSTRITHSSLLSPQDMRINLGRILGCFLRMTKASKFDYTAFPICTHSRYICATRLNHLTIGIINLLIFFRPKNKIIRVLFSCSFYFENQHMK